MWKIWEKVIEERLRRSVQVSENQFGFMSGRSSTEAIRLMRQLVELHRDKKKDLHIVFIDLEKAYDRVSREVLWSCLEAKGITGTYIRVIKDIYEETLTSVNIPGGDSEYFQVQVGLHQGSALSPFLFTAILDALTGSNQEGVPLCMLG